MEEESNKGDSNALPDPKVALMKCIFILKSAKSDNERFAGLLLVTQLVQSDAIDGLQRRELFDAVGFTFINRLLNTSTVPLDCPDGVYKSLAITMLTCFSTDQQLLFNEHMIALIPVLNEIICSSCEEDNIVSDVYQILTAFATSAQGCEYLMRHGTVPSLCHVVQETSSSGRGAQAFDILVRLLRFHSNKMWTSYAKHMMEILCYFAEKLNTLQDLTKFDVCKTLISFISGTENNAFAKAQESEPEERWKDNLVKGLRDILQSKVKAEQRDSALVLLSIVVSLNGGLNVKTLGKELTSNFFVFISTLVSVEIRLVIENGTPDHIHCRSDVLTACYCILENIISELITSQDDQSAVESDIISKVYSQVTEVMLSVLKYLQEEAVKCNVHEISGTERDFVFASARVLCCWLAEESLALQDDVLKVLPFLIKLAEDSSDFNIQEHSVERNAGKRVSFKEAAEVMSPKNVDILRFMLPALCHLSADDKARKILITNKLPQLLSKYFFTLWARWRSTECTDDESKTAMITLTGVLLNFAVTEPELVKSSESFHTIQSHITREMASLVRLGLHVVLTANLLVLGLMLTQLQGPNEDGGTLIAFYDAAVLFLRESHNFNATGPSKVAKLRMACQREWDSISELWFLGIQLLTSSINQLVVIKKSVIKSGWITELSEMANQKTGKLKQEKQDAQELLQSLLKAVK